MFLCLRKIVSGLCEGVGFLLLFAELKCLGFWGFFFEKWNLRNDLFEVVSLSEGGSVHKICLVTDNVQVSLLVLRKASCLHCTASLKILIYAVVFNLFLFWVCVSLNYVTRGFPVAVKSRHYLFNCVKMFKGINSKQTSGF